MMRRLTHSCVYGAKTESMTPPHPSMLTGVLNASGYLSTSTMQRARAASATCASYRCQHSSLGKIGRIYRRVVLDKSLFIGKVDVSGVLLLWIDPSISNSDTLQVDTGICRVDNRAGYRVSFTSWRVEAAHQSRVCIALQTTLQRGTSRMSARSTFSREQLGLRPGS
jgi:hypothetical protein